MILIEDGGAGNQRYQLHVIPAVERQILHLPLIYKAPYLTRRGVYRFTGGSRDLDRFCYLSRFQRDINCEARIRHHGDTRLHGFLETVSLCFHAVITDR